MLFLSASSVIIQTVWRTIALDFWRFEHWKSVNLLNILYDREFPNKQELHMSIRGIFAGVLMAVVGCLAASSSYAQSQNVLKECVAVSSVADDIHLCMDNYLDLMDDNINGMASFLAQSLSGEALSGLQRSQRAFGEYRRQNCLWYLEFSSPRDQAELIAKNCLATMSRQRWQELQALLGENEETSRSLTGFYVYGPGRNSFQQCGSDERYWLEGDPSVVNDAQQLYLSLATSEFQVLHAVFKGTLNTATEIPDEHVGVVRIDTLVDMSIPSDSDCKLPTSQSAFELAAEVDERALSLPTDLEVESDQDEPQQQLIAYFGDWLVDCTENNGKRSCDLKVELEPTLVKADSNDAGTLVAVREKGGSTRLELIFPNREIDTPSRIRWRIDAFAFGDLVGTSVLVDELAARQLVNDKALVEKEILPLMIEGVELSIEVLESIDDIAGEEFLGSLNGLTRALGFADEFVRDSTE